MKDFITLNGRSIRRWLTFSILVVFSFILFSKSILFYSDAQLPLTNAYFSRMFSVWDYATGALDIRHLIYWPYGVLVYIFFSFAKLFTANIETRTQVIEFLLFFVSTMVAAYGVEKVICFIAEKKKIIFREKLLSEVIIFLLTLFWIFNIWSISSIWRAFWPYMFQYCFFPLFLYLFLKCVDSPSSKNFFWLCIIAPFMLIGYVIPFSFVFDWFVILGISLTLGLKKRNIILVGGLWILLIAILTLPFLFVSLRDTTSINSSIKATTSLAPIATLLDYNSPDLLRGFAITGYPPFYNDANSLWYQHIPLLNENFYIGVFLLFLLIPLVFKKENLKDPTLIFLLGLYLVFLTFLSNVYTPLGSELLKFYSIPVFQLLRSTYVRLGEYLVIPFTLMVALGWLRIVNFYHIDFPMRRPLIWLVLGIFSFFVILPPLLCVGDECAWKSYPSAMYQYDNAAVVNVPPIQTKIPEAYDTLTNDLSKFSENNQNSNIVLISVPSDNDFKDWSQGPPFLRSTSFGKVIDSDIYSNTVEKILSSSSVRLYGPYAIVYSQDSTPTTQNQQNLVALAERRVLNGGFSKIPINKDGSESLFVFTQNNFRSPFFMFSDPQDLLKSTSTFETSEDLYASFPESFSKGTEVQSYQKESPTLWDVDVSSTKPFILSFAESFDPLWKAKIYQNGKLINGVGSISLYSVINGFKVNETGNLEIKIEYEPQGWFETGMEISVVIFLGCVAYLSYDWWRKSKKRLTVGAAAKEENV